MYTYTSLFEPTVSPGTTNTSSFAHYNTSSIFDALTQRILNVEGFKYGSPMHDDMSTSNIGGNSNVTNDSTNLWTIVMAVKVRPIQH